MSILPPSPSISDRLALLKRAEVQYMDELKRAETNMDCKESPDAHIFKSDSEALLKHKVWKQLLVNHMDELKRAQINMDCKETPDAYIFKADLPGLKKEEMKIEVLDGRILQISGERGKEEEVQEEKYHCVERWRGRFKRLIRIPENANLDEVKASMENGVLTVTVPKHPQPQPQLKIIEISG